MTAGLNPDIVLLCPQSPVPSGAITNSGKNGLPASDENLNQEC